MNAMTEARYLDGPLFNSWQSALAFAYNFTHGTLKKPFLASLLPQSHRGKGLVALDGAAQAGMIKAEVQQLPPAQRRILEGRFAPQTLPCPCKRACCVGYQIGGEWAEAVEWLTEHILKAALQETRPNLRLRRGLVVRYFGQEINIKTLAAECRVNRDTAAEHNKRAVTYLADQERQAVQGIDARLHEAGVVGS